MKPIATIAILWAVLTTDVFATSLAPMTTEQLVDASTLIVHGHVIDVRAELSPTSGVWIETVVEIEIHERLKGPSPLERVEVRVPGGSFGEMVTLVEGMPRFTVGEEVVAFLVDGPSGVRIVGAVQGKQTVRLDPRIRVPITQVVHARTLGDFRPELAPYPEPSARITLDELRARILYRVEQGWDGQPIPGAKAEDLRQRSPRSGGELQ